MYSLTKVSMLGIVAFALVAGCEEKPNATSTAVLQQTSINTDTVPIMNRLPMLGSLQSVWWQSTEISTNSFPSPPSHPVYRVRGLAQLDRIKAAEFSHDYDWQKMPINWTPDIAITNARLNLSDWNQSSTFTKDCKPAILPGALFFERSNGIVYFDIQVE